MIQLISILTMSVVVWIISIFAPSAIIDILAIGVFILFLRWLLWFNRIAFILTLPLTMYKASSFVSFVLISSGFRIPELGRIGEPSAAATSYLFLTIMFFLAITAFVEVLSRTIFKNAVKKINLGKSAIASPKNRLGIYVICAISLQIFILIAFGILNGFPLLTGTDRFFYRSMNGNQAYIYVLNFKVISAIFVGLAFFTATKKFEKFLIISSYSVLIVAYVLYGEKFNQLLLILFCASVPVLLLSTKQQVYSYIYRLIPIVSAVTVIAFVLVYYIYSDYGRLGSFETTEKIFGRMAQQSQLWYISSIQPIDVFKFDNEYFGNMIATMTSPGADEIFYNRAMGPFYFIYKYAPVGIVESIMVAQGAVQFTQVSEALFLELFGVTGLALYLIFAAFTYSFVFLSVARTIANRDYLALALWAIFISPLLAMLNQGAVHQVLGLAFTRWAIAALAVEFFTQEIRRRIYSRRSASLGRAIG